MFCRAHISLYVLRFLYFALAIKPNANEMYMQCKRFYLYYTLFLFKLATLGIMFKCYVFSFSDLYWLVGDKSV